MASRYDREGMRRGNLALLLGRLHRDGPRTRSELTADSGLSRSTVAGLVNHLASQGLVAERRATSAGRRGRPSPLVAVRSERAVALSIDIEVQSMSVATFGLGGQRLAHERVTGVEHPDDAEAVVAALGPAITRQRAALTDRQVLLGVGVAIAGLVREHDGLVYACPNLGWRDVRLGELVARAVGAPSLPVVVANEADLAARAEWYRGAGRGARHLVYLSAEVGVGAGIVIDGKPLGGARGYAGEVGHLPVNPQGGPCRCGATGCWETEVASEALVRRAQAHGRADRSASAVLAAAAAGEHTALRAVDEVAAWVGRGLAAVVNVLNPDRVVLGGLLADTARVADTALRRAFDAHALACSAQAVDIVPGALGPHAQLTGAAERLFELLVEDPTLLERVVGAQARDDGALVAPSITEG